MKTYCSIDMKFQPLLAVPLLLYLRIGTTSKCRDNYTTTQYRLCLEVGKHGLLEARIVSCPKNVPCEDPKLYPCGIVGSSNVETSTQDGGTASNFTSTEIPQTTVRSFPNPFGFSLVVNSTGTNNGSVFFFQEIKNVTRSDDDSTVGVESGTWTTVKETKQHDVATTIATVTNPTDENQNQRNLFTAPADVTTENSKTKSSPSTKGEAIASDPVTENQNLKSWSTLVPEITETETQSYQSTETVTASVVPESINSDAVTENKNLKSSSTTDGTTSPSAFRTSTQTSITTGPIGPNVHPLISGANLILSTITTILGIILGFILIDFIFW